MLKLKKKLVINEHLSFSIESEVRRDLLKIQSETSLEVREKWIYLLTVLLFCFSNISGRVGLVQSQPLSTRPAVSHNRWQEHMHLS